MFTTVRSADCTTFRFVRCKRSKAFVLNWLNTVFGLILVDMQSVHFFLFLRDVLEVSLLGSSHFFVERVVVAVWVLLPVFLLACLARSFITF